ncbi:hypothetical protein LCGC14_1207660 [marine sediment metagenome]|uniref:Uncharacterized protein n=1 Tax=marine sediment metagenome TaxID=412755 RepID=A0A0F9LEY1_9ZZZZ
MSNNLSIIRDSTGILLEVFIPHIFRGITVDSGAGLTGLVFDTAGLTAYYYRGDAANSTAITLVTMTLGAWVSGGFVVVDGTNMPGLYQLGIPDAAFVTGVDAVTIALRGAANMRDVVMEIDIVDVEVNLTTSVNEILNSIRVPKKAPERTALLRG